MLLLISNMLDSYSNFDFEAGCDEAGRGCLAGPVVAAAVILKPKIEISGLGDSKKLSAKKREELVHIIKVNSIAWAVAFVDNEEIDRINILNASILSMHRALAELDTKPKFIIVDGNRFKKYSDIPHQCIVKGDDMYQSIAAASILAKTSRDAYMLEIDNEFPQYNWRRNKAYPTLEHKRAILDFGLSCYHRKSFNSSIQMKLDL